MVTDSSSVSLALPHQRALYIPASARSSSDVSVLAEVKLSSDEDAPMCMAVDTAKTKTIVLGINEVGPNALDGKNRMLRMFRYEVQPGAENGQPT